MIHRPRTLTALLVAPLIAAGAITLSRRICLARKARREAIVAARKEEASAIALVAVVAGETLDAEWS